MAERARFEHARREGALESTDLGTEGPSNPLDDAPDGVGAGVVLYDADDRFVLCNRACRDAFPARFQSYLAPGITFESLLRACVEDGFILDAVGQEETYIHRRMKTVAEFVDSEAVLAQLRQIGVVYARGHAIGHPRPIADL